MKDFHFTTYVCIMHTLFMYFIIKVYRPTIYIRMLKILYSLLEYSQGHFTHSVITKYSFVGVSKVSSKETIFPWFIL